MKLVINYGTDYRTENFPRESEIVTIIEKKGDFAVNGRKIIFATKNTGEMEIIDFSYPVYFLLQYPLIWPYGDPGQTYEITARHPETGAVNKISRMKYLRYQLYFRPDQPDYFFRAKFLFQQLCVDMYGVIAGDRLNYRKFHNKELRVAPENDLREALAVSEATDFNANLDDIGKPAEPVILSNGFMGGAAWWKMK